MTWMSGPAGVGKSALAQTFAETIGNGMLGAAFFFSRPNKRNNPDCFFPSIAYQISTKVKPLASILNEKIDEDPSLLSKTIEVQFQELIVAPLLELKSRDREMQDRLVIVDGLDECRSDDAQCTIVRAIATAIREHGDNLPLLWAFFSRPEPHIVRTFTSHHISPLCWSTTLPVSREIDDEIRLYLRGGFENIRRRRSHIIPPSKSPWPSEEDITALVVMSAGLFVYAATVLKFIGDPDALDAKERLKTILSLRSRNSSLRRNDHSNPMEELDTLYTLIMQRIHRNVLPLTLSILLLCHELPSMPVVNPLNFANWGDNVPVLVNLLGVTFQSFDAALSKLHSVLKLDLEAPPALSREQYEESAMVPWKIHFYHASFMEFLTDPTRCGSKFWIQHPNQYTLLAKRSTDFLNGALEARVLSPGKLDCYPPIPLLLTVIVGSIISGIRLSAPLGHLEKDIRWKVREHVYRFAYAKVFDWHASANMDESLVDHLSCFDFRGYWALGTLMGLSNDELGKFITKVCRLIVRGATFSPYLLMFSFLWSVESNFSSRTSPIAHC